MKVVNINSTVINDEIQRRERRYAIKKACESILLRTGINPAGCELILIIGEGGERTNREALMYWIDGQTEEIEEPLNPADVDLLLTKLESAFKA